MQITRRAAMTSAAVLSIMPTARVRAQSKPEVKIGVLTDLSTGYSDDTGLNCIACIRQAIDEFAPDSHGFSVSLVVADNQGRVDIGASIARQWFDQGIDIILDVPGSAVALAVGEIARQKDKIMMTESTSAELTTGSCTPNTVAWSIDTYTLAKSNGTAIVKTGGKAWYFIAADYTFGHTLVDLTSKVVSEAEGNVRGTAYYPFPGTTDFSSYLLQAQTAGAQVLGLACGGTDLVNVIKQAHEFAINETMKLVPLIAYISNIHALGDLGEGLYVTEPFYWDSNERTRAFTRRVLPSLRKGTYPNNPQATNYSMAMHYLKTVAAMGAPDAKRSGRSTLARMKGLPTDDDAFGQGRLRADGRGEFPVTLWRTKKPTKPDGWDLYEPVLTIPASEALHPLITKCNFEVQP